MASTSSPPPSERTETPRRGIVLRPTVRGAVVAAVGLVLVLIGPLLGRREAVAIGLFLLAATAASWILMAAHAVLTRGPALHRLMLPEDAHVGEQVQVHLMEGAEPGRVGTAEAMEDHLPSSLHRAESDPGAMVYQLTPRRRGVFTVGPATEYRRGPLGLATGRIPRADTTVLRVLPQRLDPEEMDELLHAGAGDEQAADLYGVQASADDLLVRQHRPQDPLSRIHWGATARTRQLMVRQEESTEDPRTAVVLDCRGSSYPHRPESVDAGDGTGWSTSADFEHAVRLAATVHAELLRLGHDVVLMDHEGNALDSDLADAVLRPSTREASWHHRLPAGTDTVLAIMGAAASADLPHLQHRLGGTHRRALVVGSPSTARAWAQDGWSVVDVPRVGS